MFKKSEVKLGLDILALLNADMVQETLEESIRKIANSGISFIRFFNNDRPIMLFRNYTQAYWVKLEYALNLFKRYNIIPIISVCGYYNRNINKIKFIQRESIFKRTYEIAVAIFPKKKFIIEVANEAKKAPKDFDYKPTKYGMAGQMQKLGAWHDYVASYFESLGFPRKQVMGNCIDDPDYPKAPSTADMIIGGLSGKDKKMNTSNVIASFHKIHFFEDIKVPIGAGRIYRAKRLWKYHFTNDGKSASGRKGKGVGVGCPKRKIYINTSNAELGNTIYGICELVKSGIKRHKISIWYSDLPREYFQYEKDCNLFFDLGKLDKNRLLEMSECYHKAFKKYPENYNKFPEPIKPEPIPEPEPIEPIKPKPIIKEDKNMWQKIKSFLNFLCDLIAETKAPKWVNFVSLIAIIFTLIMLLIWIL